MSSRITKYCAQFYLTVVKGYFQLGFLLVDLQTSMMDKIITVSIAANTCSISNDIIITAF